MLCWHSTLDYYNFSLEFNEILARFMFQLVKKSNKCVMMLIVLNVNEIESAF